MAVMPEKLNAAVSHLKQGGVIAYPTEGVWGIGCDPYDETAVNRLLAIKGRPPEKGLILIAASIEQLAPILQPLSPSQMAELEKTWPGPYTWLVPDNNRNGDGSGIVPRWIKGHHDKVALRVTDHPLVQALCLQFGGPIVSTSANRSGQPVAQDYEQVLQQLPELDYVLPGELGGQGKPSQIRDIESGDIIRGT